MSTETSKLEDLLASYAAMSQYLENFGRAGVGFNFERTNDELIKDITDELKGAVADVKKTADSGSKQLKEILTAVQTLLNSLSETVSDLSNGISVSQYIPISFCVTELANSLQELILDPRLIFPRLPCNDMPVDPVLISRFKKRYYSIERTNQNDLNLKERERSMLTAPKSTLDVVKSISTSFKLISDDFLATTKALGQFSTEMQEMKNRIDELRPAAEPILSILRKTDEIDKVTSHISLMMETRGSLSPESPRDLPTQICADPILHAIQISSLFDEIGECQEVLEDAITKLRETRTSFTSVNSRLKEFLSVLLERLTRSIETARRLEANLPRISRELNEFFMPTGIKALFLKPSATLLSILEGLENVKESLSKPLLDAAKSISIIEESEVVSSVEEVKSRFQELENIPINLLNMFQTRKTGQVITRTLEKMISKLQNEIGGGLAMTAASSLLQRTGMADIADQVGHQFPDNILRNDENVCNQFLTWNNGQTSIPWEMPKFF